MTGQQQPQSITPQFGAVHFRTGNYESLAAFYRDALGLVEVKPGELCCEDHSFKLVFTEDSTAPARPPQSYGLYHLAFLLPTRAALAALVRRVFAAARGPQGPSFHIDGAADHLVSEAIYLRDADGNGVELYVDRDPAGWERNPSGEFRMDTLELNMAGLLAESGGAAGLPAGTRIGHVHLHVPNLDQAEEFFHRHLGLQTTQRSFSGARFLAWGEYHHHLGLNIWGGSTPSHGSEQPPAHACGLERIELNGLDSELDFLDPAGIRWCTAEVRS